MIPRKSHKGNSFSRTERLAAFRRAVQLGGPQPSEVSEETKFQQRCDHLFSLFENEGKIRSIGDLWPTTRRALEEFRSYLVGANGMGGAEWVGNNISESTLSRFKNNLLRMSNVGLSEGSREKPFLAEVFDQLAPFINAAIATQKRNLSQPPILAAKPAPSVIEGLNLRGAGVRIQRWRTWNHPYF